MLASPEKRSPQLALCLGLLMLFLSSAASQPNDGKFVASDVDAILNKINAGDANHELSDSINSIRANTQRHPTSSYLGSPIGAFHSHSTSLISKAARVHFTNDEFYIKSGLSQFRLFMITFNKKYERNEVGRRFETFAARLLHIQQSLSNYASGLSTYVEGINKFADWNSTELETLTGILSDEDATILTSRRFVSTVSTEEELGVPKSKDWRETGCVLRVRDQGSCGSCYAFSTLSVIESKVCLANKTILEYSPQQIVDCSKKYFNHGCSGGLENRVIKYLNDVQAIIKEERYPYEAKEGYYCKGTYMYSKFYKEYGYATNATIKGYGPIRHTEERGHDAILKALSLSWKGPLAGRLYASTSFLLYKSGILTCTEKENEKNVNHAIVLVGYGQEDGQKYWIIKNSWGTEWGEWGFARVRRGSNDCSIENLAFSISSF